MKIISWNIYRNNLKAVSKYLPKLIEDENPEVLCLQEFPHTELEALETFKPYNYILGKDYFISDVENIDNNKHRYYSVILIKKEIKYTQGEIKHKKRDNFALSYRLFKPFKYLENATPYVDFEFENKNIRLYNAHLFCVAPPTIRLKQFTEIIEDAKNKNKTSIILGDFNSFGRFYTSPILSPLYGLSRFEDLILNETKELEKIAKQNNYVNITKNINTFYLLPWMQLDYIFLDKNISYKNKGKLQTKNSDHKAIYVEL